MTTGENQMNRWVMQRLRTLSVIPLTFLLASWAAAQERSIDLPDLSPPPASQGFAPAPGSDFGQSHGDCAAVGGRACAIGDALTNAFLVGFITCVCWLKAPGWSP